jgi:hypothetical protein
LKEVQKRPSAGSFRQLGGKELAAESRFLDRSAIAEIKEHRVENVSVHPFYAPAGIEVSRCLLARDETTVDINNATSGFSKRDSRSAESFQQLPAARRPRKAPVELVPAGSVYTGRQVSATVKAWQHHIPIPLLTQLYCCVNGLVKG